MQRVTLFLCLLIPVSFYGQEAGHDSIHQLKAVEIQATRLSQFSAGIKVESIDSTLQVLRSTSTLASLLSENSAAFIRSYGTGGLATLSFRGTQTTQSAVFWNGFNLNQPNMGMTDLSHLPSLFFNEIEVQYGGASALLGSGVMGGSLHLANSTSFSTPFKSSFILGAGSFNDYSVATRMSAGNTRLAWSGALSGNFDKNNFRYTDFYGRKPRLAHAQSKSAGMIQQASYRLSANQVLSAGIWWQQSVQEIPATLVMASSDQWQLDKAFRTTLQWMYFTQVQRIQVRTAFFDEQLHYTSPVVMVDALYKLKTLALESEFKRQLGKRTELDAGFSTKLMRADVPYYSGVEIQPEAALYGSVLHAWSPGGWKSSLNLRQDFIKGYKIPFCPSIGTEGPVTRNVHARFSVSRNFRVPTMNDRFWQPGGNPDLLPESSWNQEAGFDIYFARENQYLNGTVSVTLYNMLINNLIQWMSISSNIWSPQNIQQVWSRGVETSGRINYHKEIISGYFILLYNYSPSTYRMAATASDNSIGKQLIYIPLHKLNAVFSLNRGRYFGLINGMFTGERFVQKDNEKFLPAYFVTNLTLGCNLAGNTDGFRLQIELCNLFNTEYQSVQYYPEPGRSFMLNLLVNFKHKPTS